jgi:hypothetical protein
LVHFSGCLEQDGFGSGGFVFTVSVLVSDLPQGPEFFEEEVGYGSCPSHAVVFGGGFVA